LRTNEPSFLFFWLLASVLFACSFPAGFLLLAVLLEVCENAVAAINNITNMKTDFFMTLFFNDLHLTNNKKLAKKEFIIIKY
jgi:hypothetical protein